MHTRRLVLALIVIVACPVVDAEPVRVVPGDGTVDGSFIEAYENAWSMTRRDAEGNESPAGRWTDKVELLDWKGTPALKRTQKVYGPDGELQNVQVHIVEHRSLAPILSHTYTPTGGVSHQDFDGASVKGVFVRSDQAPAMYVEGAIEAPAFNWNIFGTLLIGFPLEVGFEATFPAFNFVPNGEPMGSEAFGLVATMQWHEFSVSAEEAAAAGSLGEMKTFIVEAPQPSRMFRFNLTKQSPYIIRLENQLNDGSTMIWEME